jgi:hypothetical protein
MDASPRQGECTLGLAEAIKGDLPGVCVVCGEATSQFPEIRLAFDWQWFRLRLPDCGSHRSHSRWTSWPRRLLLLGAFLFVLGVCLIVALASTNSPLEGVSIVLGYGALAGMLLGVLTLAASLAGYALLIVQGITLGHFLGLGSRRVEIRRLEQDIVTLVGVAPEFVEALRVYRGD